MALKPVTQLQHPEPLINRIQSVIVTALNQVLIIPFLDGQIITSVFIPAGVPTAVSHRLQRPVANWFVTKIDANTVIWESPSTDPNNTIVLNSSANVTINVWVS